MEHVKLKYEDNVLVITLDRLDKKNAITSEMYLALAGAIADANQDEKIHAIVLQGSSTIFSSGNDIQTFADAGGSEEESASQRFMLAVINVDKPLVAGVCGYAVGIGATVLLHCDYVVASEDARIRFPFVDLGLCPEFASTLLLPSIVGSQKASEWLLLGTTVLAGEAYRSNPVNRVLPNDMVLEDALSVAKSLASKPQLALMETRRLLRSTRLALSTRHSLPPLTNRSSLSWDLLAQGCRHSSPINASATPDWRAGSAWLLNPFTPPSADVQRHQVRQDAHGGELRAQWFAHHRAGAGGVSRPIARNLARRASRRHRCQRRRHVDMVHRRRSEGVL